MTESDTAVAIAGLALRVPGAGSPEEFWSALRNGRVTLPAARGTDPSQRLGAGQIDRFAQFDAELFAMPPAHAAATDPQHRVLTELVWEALEDAGTDTERTRDRVGIFVGCGAETYLYEHVLRSGQTVRTLGREQIALAGSRDFLATGVAFRLGCTGPAVTVQSACSTSLVAVHQAVRSLLTYECDIAVAGAVSIHPEQHPAYTYTAGGITSPDGRCRAFTQGSGGTVPSSGGAVVVLRRAADVAAGERVRGRILGSAVNNDGADRMGLAAPSPRGQAEVLREALDTAGLAASDVGFVETHGTGTALGDQIELAALTEVYGAAARPVRLALGAVKANIGHCDTASGVLGLIKTVLAMEHDILPPTPAQPGDGPDADLGSPRFFLPRQAAPWPTDLPRRTAVSSFGLGGTNAHVVLEPAGPAAAALRRPPTGARAAVLSAATPQALRAKARALHTWLTGPAAAADLDDVLGTLWHTRRALPERWGVALPDDSAAAARDRLLTALSRAAEGAEAQGASGAPFGRRARAVPEPRVAVLLPGQGGALHRLGAGPAAVDEVFRTERDALSAVVLSAEGPDLRDVDTWDADDPRLKDTAVVQPLLFVVGLAALRALGAHGIRPDVLLGHSIGELTAAAHAGVFTDEDAAAAVVRRGRVMADADEGVMVAVRADEAEALRLADGLAVDVCALNAPDNTVLGGPAEPVAELEERCRAGGVKTTRLGTERAFHSRSMAHAAEEFERFVATLQPKPPAIRVLSCLTGRELTAEQATSPAYWGEQLRRPVRFGACLDTVLDSGASVVIGVPGARAVTSLARQAARRRSGSAQVVDVDADAAPGDPAGGGAGRSAWAGVPVAAWTAGCPVLPLAARPAVVVPLPAYPFADTRHWIAAADLTTAAPRDPLPGAVAAPDAADEPAAPGPEAEGVAAAVLRIWQEAFGGEALGPEDNFFGLGGTSLQAAQLISVVNEELLVDAQLLDLYEHSSVGAFAVHVEELTRQRDDAELLRLLDEIETEQPGEAR